MKHEFYKGEIQSNKANTLLAAYIHLISGVKLCCKSSYTGSSQIFNKQFWA